MAQRRSMRRHRCVKGNLLADEALSGWAKPAAEAFLLRLACAKQQC
jgi:hypothetical protein